MKKLVVVLFCLLTVIVHAQEPNPPFDGHKWEAPYSLSIPTGWTIERFLLPPFFAPAITYKGVEDIRFTPGWADAKSHDYWSYVFLWYLDKKPVVNTTTIEKDLEVYYTGLIKVNTDSSKHAGEEPILVKAKFNIAKSLPGDFASFTGTVYMRDFLGREPIILNCRVHAKTCTATGKTILFFELSPQAFTDTTWKLLNLLWDEFKCQKQ
jgi:hypothetical protein